MQGRKSTETPPGMCREDFGQGEKLRKLNKVCVEKISARTKSMISPPGMCREDFGGDENLKKFHQVCVEKISMRTKIYWNSTRYV